MKAILYHLDGSLPNLALMRIAAHHRAKGDVVEIRHGRDVSRQLWDTGSESVYGSLIFTATLPVAESLVREWPAAQVGGTGINVASSLDDVGITTDDLDYSIYPDFTASIGFTQRGCRLSCKFCVVPRKEGRVAGVATVDDIWRGDPHPRHLILLDNDFFGQAQWRDRIAEIRGGGYRVSFSQGINVRLLDDEVAEAVASVDYRAMDMKTRRIYTAWDNRKDESRVFAGLHRLVRAGVRPDHIMVYMLIGYWPGETMDDRLYRARMLRDFGARPYPMPYVRTRELVGFQRWCIGAYDKRVSWAEWVDAKYQPRRLGVTA